MLGNENAKNMSTTSSATMPIVESTDAERESSSIPNLSNSGAPSSDLKKRWRQPKNVKELIAQINEIATMVLNDEISLDKATKYSSLARGAGQLLNIELYRARMLKQTPDTSFEDCPE